MRSVSVASKGYDWLQSLEGSDCKEERPERYARRAMGAALGHGGAQQHLELARRVFTRLRPGSYVALHVDDLDTLRLTLGERFAAVGQIRSRL